MTSTYDSKYRQFLSKLRKAREEAALTQTQVASALGKPQTFVSKSELGERRVDFIEVEQFARVYGKPLSYFESSGPGTTKR